VLHGYAFPEQGAGTTYLKVPLVRVAALTLQPYSCLDPGRSATMPCYINKVMCAA
jgi:hypothetical protein